LQSEGENELRKLLHVVAIVDMKRPVLMHSHEYDPFGFRGRDLTNEVDIVRAKGNEGEEDLLSILGNQEASKGGRCLARTVSNVA